MEKKILFSILLLITGIPVLAATMPEKVPNKLEAIITKFNIDREVNAIVNAKFNSDIPASNNAIYKMRDYGAKDIRVRFSKPCPCSGKAEINGKIIEAKDKHCAIVSYKYNGQKYESGKCKKLNTDKK